ncbi:hypothetical protein CEN49_27055 [Fischerella thermalis CCMEE 5273]|nr:hypothetical protein CEN49_27055 [Fischerella thermalis CCMEE 5273]
MAMTSTWMGRWFPWLGSGGAAGVGETATFDFLKEGKVNWKNALLAGLLGGLLGFGGGVITDHGHKLKALIPQLENRVVVAADGPVGRFIYNHFDDAADGYRRSQGNGETSTTTRDGAKVTSAYGYASKVSDRTTVTGEYPDSDWEKERSKILRAELKAAEVEPPPYPNAAHHIVPWNDPRADQAQKILKEYGIETESAVNGVFLPYEKGSKYIGDEALHSGNHGKNYVMEVNNRLVEAKEEGGTREDIVDELNQIRKELLDGTLSLN